MSFDFGTYNDLKNAINASPIMEYTLIGGQSVACIWIIIKFIHEFMKDTFEGQAKMSNIINSASLIFFVIVAPYVMDILDNTFASVEEAIQGFDGQKLPQSIKDSFMYDMFGEGEAFDTGEGFLPDMRLLLISLLKALVGLIGFLLWAVDKAIFAIFYIERLVVLELYRFIFPIFIAFVGFDGLRNRYYKWVVSFIGVLILPIPYIAIHNAVDLMSNMIINNNKTGGVHGTFLDMLITIVVLITSIGIKYKLLSQIGNKVSNILN